MFTARRILSFCIVLIAATICFAPPVHGQKSKELKDSDKPGPLCPSKHSSYAAIDKHALQAPKDVEASVASLTAYLIRPAKTDAEKARAIFRWLTDRVVYDMPAFLANKLGGATAQKTLATRQATCEGYGRLFKAMCDEAKLEAAFIPGYVRSDTSKPDDPLKTNHGWNAVKLDGRWYLVDATWGAGNVSPETRKWEKRFREFFFLTPPELLIFSHYPEAPAHQLLKEPISAKSFRQRLQVPNELVLYGAAVKDIQAALDAKDFRGFVTISWDPNAPLKIVEAPLPKSLKRGDTYRFRFEASGCSAMGLVNNGPGQPLKRMGQEFVGTVTASAGKLQIGAQFTSKGATYWTFLQYDVE